MMFQVLLNGKRLNTCGILEVFYNSTNIFSGHLYSTANLFFEKIYEIQSELINLKDSEDDHIRNMAMKMHSKFDKYWRDKYTLLPSQIATFLYPRCKLEYLHFCYSKIYPELDVEFYISSIEDTFRALFSEYTLLYQESQEPVRVSTSQVVIDNVISPCKRKGNIRQMFWKEKKEKEKSNVDSGKSEIQCYLDDNTADYEQDDDRFDILRWWRENSNKYKILSRMAQDFLAIPVSTVASESAFSTGGRVLDQYRSRLDPDIVEALICTQDWLHGENACESDDDQVEPGNESSEHRMNI